MKKNDKRKIRIWKKTFALALSSVHDFFLYSNDSGKGGDESPEAIINGLVDLPKTFIDKDSQDLGSDRVFYRNTNTDLSMLPAECYKKALQSYIIDDDVLWAHARATICCPTGIILDGSYLSKKGREIMVI